MKASYFVEKTGRKELQFVLQCLQRNFDPLLENLGHRIAVFLVFDKLIEHGLRLKNETTRTVPECI